MDFYNGITPVEHWLSLGHSRQYAVAMFGLQLSLIKWTHSLRRLRVLQEPTPGTKVKIVISPIGSPSILPEGMLLHDDSLLLLWKRFAYALELMARYDRDVFTFHLTVVNVELPTRVLSMMAPSLGAISLDRLFLYNNRLENGGVKILASVLAASSSIRVLVLGKNEMNFGANVAISLADAARNHPRLEFLFLNECNISHDGPAMVATVPAIFNIFSVSLQKAGLRSQDAALISTSLATSPNPSIKFLHLDGNLFNDEDALLFANALRCNTKLLELSLSENKFTDSGIKILVKSIFNDVSLNAIHDSNHMCALKLFAANELTSDGLDLSVLHINTTFHLPSEFRDSVRMRCVRAAKCNFPIFQDMLQAKGRSKEKMLHALGSNKGRVEMRYLNHVSLEVMPKMLAFLQGNGKSAAGKRRSLNIVYGIIRARPGVVVSFGVPMSERGGPNE